METKTNHKTTNQKGRRAGVLMPVSSLPSDCGIGTLGDGAYAFVDWLHLAGMKIWQVLPLLPTGYGDSPYQSCASGALNYYFIDFERLCKDGLLQKSDYIGVDFGDDERRVDYGKQFENKIKVLKIAYQNFKKKDKVDCEWKAFLDDGKYYDFALFMSLKVRFHYATWEDWDEPFRNCEKEVVAKHERDQQDEILFWQFTQFIFLKQWNALHEYANRLGIEIMGDMPIYVAYDSVETWKHRDKLFMLDEAGNTALRAGVPPDAFCDDGQLWGNPVYDWVRHEKDGYSWWKARIQDALEIFDIVRIDHFRAFDRFYAIPNDAETAKVGEWLDGPKEKLFKDMKNCAIIAEDLGTIDDGVRALLQNTGYPGMKVFEFAFDGNAENEYLPCFYNENCVAYTGTHDNQTLRAFMEEMQTPARKEFQAELENQCLQADVAYISETVDDECESVIRLLIASKADTVIIPMHDILCLDDEARLNAPATVSNRNWTYRYTECDFKRRKAFWLKELTTEYDR